MQPAVPFADRIGGPVSGSVFAVCLGDFDDATLVQRIAAADQQALAVLWERHRRVCYHLARRITGCDTLAEDAVQETFLSLWRNPAGYLPSQGSVRGWLAGLAHHKAVDAVRAEVSERRRQARAMRDERDPAGDPAELAWQAARVQAVRSALALLPEIQRQTLALAYFGGYKQREIAELTGVPLGTVKTRTFAALRRLRDGLADLRPPGAPLAGCRCPGRSGPGVRPGPVPQRRRVR